MITNRISTSERAPNLFVCLSEYADKIANQLPDSVLNDYLASTTVMSEKIPTQRLSELAERKPQYCIQKDRSVQEFANELDCLSVDVIPKQS